MNIIQKLKNIIKNNEKSQVELRLKEIEQEFNFIKKYAETSTWIIDTSTFKYTYISSACKHIYGYDVEEYSQLSMYDVLSRGSLKVIFNEYNRLRKKYYSGEIDKIEATLDVQKYHKDGHLIWIEVSAKLVPDENGELTKIVGHSHIIDDRKKYELELKEVEQKYKILSANTTETMFILDITDFSFKFMSDSTVRVFGYTSEETKNIYISEIFPTESIQLIKKHIAEEFAKYYNGELALGELPSSKFEVQQYYKDGSLIWTEITENALPSTREDGKLTQIIGTTRNIDDRKRMELKLMEQSIKLEQQHNEILLQKDELENIRDAIFLLDVETFVLNFRGKSAKDVTGFDPGDVPLTTIFPPESLMFVEELIETEFTKYYNGELNGKLPEAIFEINSYHKDGSLMWIEVSANALSSTREDGKLTTIVGTIRRIDLRKEMELKLMEQSIKLEQQHNEILLQKDELENIRDAIFLLDVETFTLDFRGKSAINVTGYAPGEALNYPITAIFPTESLVFIKELIETEFTKYYRGELTEGKLPEAIFEVQQYHKDGSLMWVEVSANALPSTRKDGNLTTFVGTARRIDLRKEMEVKLMEQSTKLEQQHQELMKQKEELEYANRTKDKFFSIIAHDLRNPITAMINIASVFKDYYHQMDQENIANSINILFQSTSNISNLLENLLQWSRSSIGSIEFHSIKSNINEITNITFEDISTQAQSKNIKLTLENKTTHEVHCDPNMINAILRNLISNAIKFSENGKNIYVIIDDYLEDNKYVVVAVKDEGVGMDANLLNRLFRLGTKISTIGISGEIGTGLGLILCKEFIDKHNCKIWVKSQIGVGTTFYFTLLKA